MFGFLVGTACLVGLIKVARCGYGGGGGCGYGGGRWGRGGYGGRWSGGRWMLRHLFERLETTPGQEKVIFDATDAVQKAWAKVWEEKEKSRQDLGRAVKGERFDQSAVREMFSRHDAVMDELRKTITGELAKVHEVLDERQRREVGDLLEHGFWGGGRRGWGGGRWGRGGGYSGQYV
jgi:Spy/CpxP family protein refolding chaperone